MKCANCGAAAAEGAAECPGCGVIFAKLKAKIDQTPAPARPINPWIGRAIAAGLAISWAAAWILYFQHYTRTHPKLPEPPRASPAK